MGGKSAALKTSEWVRRLPKIELHVHLDGAFDENVLFKEWLKNKESLDVPEDVASKLSECKDIEAFRQVITSSGNRSLQKMFECFDAFLPLVVGNLELVEELAYRFFKTQVEQNVIYTEVRYCPQLLDKNADPVGVVEAVTNGLRRGYKEHPDFFVNQILSCMDSFPQWSIPIVELANKHKDDFPCAVVGVDIAGGENYLSSLSLNKEDVTDKIKLHKQAMDMAKDMGLNITIHAGEVGGTENILYAVESLGAKRIGHGYIISDENSAENLLALVKKGIHFEVCPTSSFETGGWQGESGDNKLWDQHPLLTMLDAGASVSINSDDPTVFATSTSNDYELTINDIGISRADMIKVLESSVNASFCPDKQKKMLMKRVKAFTQKYK